MCACCVYHGAYFQFCLVASAVRTVQDEDSYVYDLGILDFGLARTTVTEEAQYTDMDVVTREYRAPEVHFKRGEVREYGPPIDMWAFGVILAEVLTPSSPKKFIHSCLVDIWLYSQGMSSCFEPTRRSCTTQASIVICI